jgi:hypothetical protein
MAQTLAVRAADPDPAGLFVVCRTLNPAISMYDTATIDLALAHARWSKACAGRRPLPAPGGRVPPLQSEIRHHAVTVSLTTARRTARVSETGAVTYGIELSGVSPAGPRVVTVWRGVDSVVWILAVWLSRGAVRPAWSRSVCCSC